MCATVPSEEVEQVVAEEDSSTEAIVEEEQTAESEAAEEDTIEEDAIDEELEQMAVNFNFSFLRLRIVTVVKIAPGCGGQ